MTSDHETRAQEYASKHSLKLTKRLGHGEDGTVWSTDAKTAVKSHRRSKNSRMELGCYQRLEEHAIREILGLAVPQLQGFDDDLWVLEIAIVEPPRILDFGKAYLDSHPEHSPEVLEETEQKYSEIWGEKWPTVAAVMWKLERPLAFTTKTPAQEISILANSYRRVSLTPAAGRFRAV